MSCEGAARARRIAGAERVRYLVDMTSAISDVRSSMEHLRAIFNPTEAADAAATLLFVISGPEPGQPDPQEWTVAIAGGTCAVERGAAGPPTVTLRIPRDVWLAMAKGEKSGRDAFMNGEYQVEGDIMFMMRFGKIFPLKA
jgi:putative sterol carrier protein